MGFELFIARKHLFSRRKTTLICIAGIAVGVAALIVVLAVFTGFQSQLKKTMVGVHPHIRIEKWGGITDPLGEIEKIKSLNIPGLKTVAPFVAAEAMLQSPVGATGVLVRGVDPVREDLEVFRNHLVAGNFQLGETTFREKKRFLFFFTRTVERRCGEVLIGEGLAHSLRLRVGDRVTVIAPPLGEGGETFSLKQAESRTFVVSGIFNLGMNEFDTSYLLMNYHQAQKLYRLGDRVGGISVRFDDVDQALKWIYVFRSELPSPYVVTTWHDVNPHFFQALKVEKSVQTIFLGLIILVAAFNIFSTLIMIVLEKTRDIGILRALGATAHNIRRIFMLQGLTIGVLGVMMGTLSGLVLLHYRNDILDYIKETTSFELFPSDVYLFHGLPAEVQPQDIGVIIVLALVATVLAAVYPSHRAAKLDPVEALRYE